MAVTQQSAAFAKTATGVAGTALTTVGSAVLPVPVVGWIVGGLLVAAGGILSVASSKYDPERAGAKESMLRQGMSWEFSQEFAKVQNLPDAAVEKRVLKHRKAYERSGRVQDRDQMLAGRHALYMRSLSTTVDTAITVQQVQLDAEIANWRRTRLLALAGSAAFAVFLGVFAVSATRRKR